MLGALCTLYGWTLSRLMADAETPPPNYIPAGEQAHWTDPESGYRRRAVSPPSPGLRGEMVEVHIPAGATVSFETSPIAGLEHHLWMLEGAITIDVDGSSVSLRTGDCLRYVLNGPSQFQQCRQARGPLRDRDGAPMTTRPRAGGSHRDVAARARRLADARERHRHARRRPARRRLPGRRRQLRRALLDGRIARGSGWRRCCPASAPARGASSSRGSAIASSGRCRWISRCRRTSSIAARC